MSYDLTQSDLSFGGFCFCVWGMCIVWCQVLTFWESWFNTLSSLTLELLVLANGLTFKGRARSNQLSLVGRTLGPIKVIWSSSTNIVHYWSRTVQDFKCEGSIRTLASIVAKISHHKLMHGINKWMFEESILKFLSEAS